MLHRRGTAAPWFRVPVRRGLGASSRVLIEAPGFTEAAATRLACGAAAASSLHPAALVAGLFVVAVLFQTAQNARLLQLIVEALEGAIDAFVW